MAKLLLPDLSQKELDALHRIQMSWGVAPEMLARLKELGLTEQKLGGTGLSQAGHEILDQLAAIVRAREPNRR
jgi:hypothetical protein